MNLCVASQICIGTYLQQRILADDDARVATYAKEAAELAYTTDTQFRLASKGCVVLMNRVDDDSPPFGIGRKDYLASECQLQRTIDLNGHTQNGFPPSGITVETEGSEPVGLEYAF